MKSPGSIIAAAAVMALAFIAPAAADYEQFQAPSGNIHCGYYSDETITSLRCDIRETSKPAPAAPADCELDWGNAFEMAVESQHAERICHGDTVADDNSPVVEYGDTWERDGFTCKSEKTGMNCRNQNGAGWDLSRAKQKLY